MLYRKRILVCFKNNTELKRELKRHLMLNLAVHVLTTYPINIPLKKKKRRDKKKKILECLKRSLLSLHEIQNRTANKFLFTQSSELFSFVCSISRTSVFKFTISFRMVCVYICECIRRPVSKNICYFRMFLMNFVTFCDKPFILETLFIL